MFMLAIKPQVEHSFNAGAAIMMLNSQPRPAVAPLPDLFPKRKHCTTLGYGVQCAEY